MACDLANVMVIVLVSQLVIHCPTMPVENQLTVLLAQLMLNIAVNLFRVRRQRCDVDGWKVYAHPVQLFPQRGLVLYT